MTTAAISRSTEPAAQRGVLRSINPYDGQLLKSFPEMSEEELACALAAAHARFPSWQSLPVAERGATLRQASCLCRERQEGVARTMKVEMGKRISRVAKRSISAVAFQFGGSKESGYGRECCEPGIHEFVNAKVVRVLR